MDQAAIKASVLTAISPLKPADATTLVTENFPFSAHRTDAGRSLPPYYLVYFLLVDLLGFENLGQSEKTAWSVPVDFNGQAFLIEYRKFGLGIFAEDVPANEAPAAEIAKLINAGVKIAEPFFTKMADEAASGSNLNVINRAYPLYERHRYYMDQYLARSAEAENRKNESVVTKTEHGTLTTFPASSLKQESIWLALSAIESFFSWTEHIFIHLGILQGKLLTGRDVKDMANKNWYNKFEIALDISNTETNEFYNELKIIRQQIRNFDAHGSFGKSREAFSFHSSVGAVPLRLPYQRDLEKLKFGQGIDFVEHDAIQLIERFTDHIWSEDRTPAKIYIQDSSLPLILSHAKDGKYAKAMLSEDDMNSLVEHLSYLSDQYANMDF